MPKAQLQSAKEKTTNQSSLQVKSLDPGF